MENMFLRAHSRSFIQAHCLTAKYTLGVNIIQSSTTPNFKYSVVTRQLEYDKSLHLFSYYSRFGQSITKYFAENAGAISL
jgi:hypothetical protein